MFSKKLITQYSSLSSVAPHIISRRYETITYQTHRGLHHRTPTMCECTVQHRIAETNTTVSREVPGARLDFHGRYLSRCRRAAVVLTKGSPEGMCLEGDWVTQSARGEGGGRGNQRR